MDQKKNTWQGFLALFLSMLLYAFSGIVVVGLAAAFGSIGQVTFRALAAIVLTLIWLAITGFRYKFSKEYETKWLVVDFVLRPIYNICFVYSVLAIGPTAALFYLFASKVIVGGVIKGLSGEAGKLGKVDLVSFGIVVIGLFLFSYPISSALSTGVLFALTSGTLEAVKSRAMEKLSVASVDQKVVSLYEFISTGLISFVVVLVLGQSFVIAPMTIAVWKVLVLSAVVAVAGLALDLYGFANFDSDLGNAILASEMGFAGLLNYLVLGTVMTLTQILGSALLVVSIAIVALASYNRNKGK